MYSGSIPSSTLGLLLGGCRLGIEPLVFATLHLPSMEKISVGQLQKASDIAEEFGHDSVVECLGQVLKSCLFVSRGSEGSEKNGRRDLPSQMRPSSSWSSWIREQIQKVGSEVKIQS